MHEKKNTILVVDGEPKIQKMLEVFLDAGNYKIVDSISGKQALRMCASVKPDLILLELRLPDMDGKDIILSVCSSDEEIVTSLNMGANDYVTKPFNVDVLMARINAALRTSAVQETGEPELCNGPLRMDLVRHEVFLHDKLQAFTPREYDLLRHFMVNRGKMLTHKEILKKVWGAAHAEDTTYLRVYIGQIRVKIEENPAMPLFITTKPGIGYRMEVH